MTKSRRVRYSTRGLPVSDRERLARIFATLERRSGGQKAAARALGITPPYFWRLRHGKGGEAISRGLFDRIAALLGADKRTVRELKRAVVNAETRPQRRAYYAWLHRGYRLMTAGGWPWWNLYSELPKHAQGRISAFVQRWEGRGHVDRRAWFGVFNALAPLLASQETSRIERSWQELEAADELGVYLNAALRAQDVILNREGDVLKRSQQVAERSP